MQSSVLRKGAIYQSGKAVMIYQLHEVCDWVEIDEDGEGGIAYWVGCGADDPCYAEAYGAFSDVFIQYSGIVAQEILDEHVGDDYWAERELLTRYIGLKFKIDDPEEMKTISDDAYIAVKKTLMSLWEVVEALADILSAERRLSGKQVFDFLDMVMS